MSRLKVLKPAGSGHDQVSPTTAWVRMVAIIAAENNKAKQASTRRKTQQDIKRQASRRLGTQQAVKQQASRRLRKQHAAI